MNQLSTNRKRILIKLCLYLFVFQLLFAVGCKEKKQKWMITGLSGKDWNIYKMKGKIYKRPLYGYHFQNNGDCFYYFYSRNAMGKIEKNKFDFGDVIYPDSWDYINDSTMNIRGRLFSFLYLSTDSMVVISKMNVSDTLYLTHSKY